MKIKKSISILFIGFIVSLLFLATQSKVQAQQMDYVPGCCQFYIDSQPGCIYPASADGCTGDGKTFVDGGICDIDTGYCSGLEKDAPKSSESEKQL